MFQLTTALFWSVFAVQFLLGFDVNQNLCHIRESPTNFILDLVRQQMPFADGEFAIDNNVKVYIEAESHFANQALVQAKDAWHTFRHLPYLGSYLLWWSYVRKFKKGRTQLLPGRVENHESGTHGCPSIGCLRSRPAKQGNGKARERKGGCECVTSVVPSITLDRFSK